PQPQASNSSVNGKTFRTSRWRYPPKSHCYKESKRSHRHPTFGSRVKKFPRNRIATAVEPPCTPMFMSAKRSRLKILIHRCHTRWKVFRDSPRLPRSHFIGHPDGIPCRPSINIRKRSAVL